MSSGWAAVSAKVAFKAVAAVFSSAAATAAVAEQ